MTDNNVQVDGNQLKVKARDWPIYLVGSNYDGVFGELVYRQPEPLYSITYIGKGKTNISSVQPYTVNTTTSSNAPGYFGNRQPDAYFGKEKTMSIWYSDDERDYNYPETALAKAEMATALAKAETATAPAKVTYKGSTYGLVHESQLRLMPWIRKVIFNPPATIVFWTDGTKTVVKAKQTGKKKEQDKFSEEYGLAMAIAKRFCITRGEFLKAVENASRPGKNRK